MTRVRCRTDCDYSDYGWCNREEISIAKTEEDWKVICETME